MIGKFADFPQRWIAEEGEIAGGGWGSNVIKIFLVLLSAKIHFLQWSNLAVLRDALENDPDLLIL